jgi:hypothetical protein
MGKEIELKFQVAPRELRKVEGRADAKPKATEGRRSAIGLL